MRHRVRECYTSQRSNPIVGSSSNVRSHSPEVCHQSTSATTIRTSSHALSSPHGLWWTHSTHLQCYPQTNGPPVIPVVRPLICHSPRALRCLGRSSYYLRLKPYNLLCTTTERPSSRIWVPPNAEDERWQSVHGQVISTATGQRGGHQITHQGYSGVQGGNQQSFQLLPMPS